jgi:putative FmdB family regulatory protein
MPVYEFKCDQCGHKFETFKHVDNRNDANCPLCGKPARRLFSPVSFSFGWVLSERSHEIGGPKEEFVKNI